MSQFIIEESFTDLFPNAKIGIVICRGIDNKIKDELDYANLLDTSAQAALQHLGHDEFSKNPVIQVWREAFLKFKTKKGARSSIEALLKRVKKGNSVGPINPLVDIYNAISLKYALPCGGEDISKFEGNVRLTTALGGEDFITYGSDQSAPPLEGEVVYKDDAGAICRCWNWRESVRTMLTEETEDAFMCLELVDDTRMDIFQTALNELAELVSEHLGGQCEQFILDKNNNSLEI